MSFIDGGSVGDLGELLLMTRFCGDDLGMAPTTLVATGKELP
jgi:hypothetical protein